MFPLLNSNLFSKEILIPFLFLFQQLKRKKIDIKGERKRDRERWIERDDRKRMKGREKDRKKCFILKVVKGLRR